ncbi:MAG: hypothetical protein BWX80_02841 [Candidatus Hydrogenedentes bacterium ADurb.Bin101]|nr:MAG: hypothetical protein BWX80_02841 [Candidatus Hydrogenedentes bacterium ADurb.Bin101]
MLPVPVRKGSSGKFIDFQGTNDPYHVIFAAQQRGIHRIHGTQLFQQRGVTHIEGAGAYPLADALVACGALEQAVYEGADIQPGTADQYGNPATVQQVRGGFTGHPFIPARSHVGIGRENPDEMMTDIASFYKGGCCRADFHTAIELHGIRRQHFRVQAQGQRHCQARLARSGWADHGDRLFHCILRKLFSICWRVNSTMMGRPWGHVYGGCSR